MIDNEEFKNSIKEINMLNKINDFAKLKKLKYEYYEYDLNIIGKIFNISDSNFVQIVKENQRKIDYIMKTKNKIRLKFDLNNNKYFHFLIYYYFYKYNKILPYLKIFYKSNLISFHTIFLFFDFFIDINEENKKEMNLYLLNIISIISNIKKIIKITKISEINDKKEINNDIKNVLGKIFNMNDNQSIQNIIFCTNLVKYPKILSLLKLSYDYYSNDILNDDNKQFIINNLKKLFSKALNKEHSKYLYSISKKYLKSNFNNQIKNQEKNYFKFYKRIIDFFEYTSKKDKKYSLDKYFIFNSSEEKKGILTTSPIIINENQINEDINLSFIFSFKQIKSSDKNIINKNSVIFSVNDFNSKKYIFRFIIKNNNLNLNLFINNREDNIILLENIKNNFYYLCFFCINGIERCLYFHINNDDYIDNNIKNNIKNNVIYQEITKKDINQIYFELGNSIDNNNNKKFNGFIGPLLVFNSKVDNPLDVYQKLMKIKKYYLLGDIFNKEENKKNDNETIYFSYEEYNGIMDNKTEIIKIINDLKNVLTNLIFYINPEVILNNLNFYEGKKFRDYQIYNDPFDIKNHWNTNKYYEIKDEKNINNFILIENSFFEFFINNKIFDFIILNIELIYNKLLISDYNNICENEFLLL